MKPVERMEMCFKFAEEQLQVPSLLDPHLVETAPDDLSIMTYLTYFRKKVILN
jgi:hypothetical protein